MIPRVETGSEIRPATDAARGRFGHLSVIYKYR